MKKKLILALAISVILTCLFAFAVSAAEYQQNEKGIWYSTSDEIPPKEYVNYFVTATEGTVGETEVDGKVLQLLVSSYYDDTMDSDFVVLANGDGTYSAYPTVYIVDTNHHQSERWKGMSPSRLNALTGYTYSAYNTGSGSSVAATEIVRIMLPKNVKYLHHDTRSESTSFKGVTGLKEVIFPSTFISITIGSAFEGCTSLERVDFSACTTTSNMSLSGSCFKNCSALEEFEFPPNARFTPSDSTFYGCSALTDETFDFGKLTHIGKYTFRYTNFVNIDMSDSTIKTIDQEAFYGCTTIKTIKMPLTLTRINAVAFRDCTSLEFIEFGNNQNEFTMPGWGVFYNCKSLKAVSLPVNTISIPDRGFSSCTALTAVYLGEKLEAIYGNKGDGSGDGPAFGSNINMYFVQNSFSVLKADGSFYSANEYVPPEKPNVYYFPSTLKTLSNKGNTNDYFYMRDFKYTYTTETVVENGVTTITYILNIDENGYPVISYGSNNVPNFNSAVLDKDGNRIVNDYVYLFEYETDENGNLIFTKTEKKENNNTKITYTYYPVIKRDAEGNIVYRLDENGERIKLFDSKGVAIRAMYDDGMVRNAGATDRGISGCTNLNSVLVFPEGFTGYYDGTQSYDENQRGDIFGDGLLTKCATAQNPITLVFLGRIDRVSFDRKNGNTSYLTYMFANPANTSFENTKIGTWYNITDSNYSNQTEMYVIFCHAEGGAQKYKINFEGSADNKYYPALKATEIAATAENLGTAQNWHAYKPGTDYESDATCLLPAGEFKLCFCGNVCYSNAKAGSVALGHVKGDDLVIHYPVSGDVIDFFQNAIHTYTCQREGCGIKVDEEKAESALFTEKGYSKETYEGGNAFTYGIKLNKDAEKEYVENGNVVSYGFIIGAETDAGTNGNIMNADGTTNLQKYVLTDFAVSTYETFSIYNVRMFGLDEDQLDDEVYCCAYVINNGEVYYVGEAVTKQAVMVSYVDIPPVETTESGKENA